MSVLDLEGHGHAIVIKACRAVCRRCLVNCFAVRPERRGSVANRASERHGHSAEAGGEAASAGPDGEHNYSSPDIASHSNARSNAIGSAELDLGEACRN
jgi:hypothetical protein